MSDVYSLLNIEKERFQDFHLLGSRVDDYQTEKCIKQNIRKLKGIAERLDGDIGCKASQQSIDEVVSKVIRMSPSGDTSENNWSVKELRIVSYCMMKLCDDKKYYMYALKLLDNNWRDMFFNGLAFYLLKSWYTIDPECREKTSQLIVKN